jgi:cobalamin biosynthesis protein CobT
MNQAVFQQRLTSIMTDNMYQRYARGRTRGKLDTDRLYKVRTGSENVFKQKTERKGKNYNIMFAVDASGSMGTRGWGANKMPLCADALDFMQQSFLGLGINTGVVTYNALIQHVKPMGNQRFKSLKESLIEEVETYKHRLPNGQPALGCNHDYDGIKRAYELLERTKGSKILVILSDGKPNCDWDQRCGYDKEKHKVERISALIEEHKRIPTIVVGLLYDVPYGETMLKIDNLNELAPQLIQVLNKQIRRG